MIAGSSFGGPGTSCLGDNDDSGKEDACDEPIPAVSDWGVLTLTLALLTAGTLLFRRPRTVLP